MFAAKTITNKWDRFGLIWSKNGRLVDHKLTLEIIINISKTKAAQMEFFAVFEKASRCMCKLLLHWAVLLEMGRFISNVIL